MTTKVCLTVKDGAVVLQWRLIPHFDQVVIVSTLPDPSSDVRHVTAAPPVVRGFNYWVDAIRIPSSKQQQHLTFNVLLDT